MTKGIERRSSKLHRGRHNSRWGLLDLGVEELLHLTTFTMCLTTLHKCG